MDHLGAELAGQFDDQLVFPGRVTAVADETRQPNAPGAGIFDDALGDVIGRVHGHHFARADDVDLLGLVLADGHGETATDDIAQHVIEDEVEILVVGTLFLQEVDGRDDTATGATDAGLGAARFDALDIAVTDLEHVFQLQVLDGTGIGGHLHDGILRLGVQDQAGGVGLGVAADDHDLFTEFGQTRYEVLGGRGLTDAAFTVDGALTYCHGDISCGAAARGREYTVLSISFLQSMCQRC